MQPGGHLQHLSLKQPSYALTMEVMEKAILHAHGALLSPLLCYIKAGCCLNTEHAPNRRLATFKSTLINGLERIQKNLKSLVERGGALHLLCP